MTDSTPYSENPPFASLIGRKALVTGSSSGIGAAIAIEFARAGADVVLHCAKSTVAADRVKAKIEKLGRRAVVMATDLADAGEHLSFVNRAWEQFGGIDLWVNNAGVDLLTGAGKSLPYSDKLQKLWEVDVRGTVLLSRLVGERMRAETTTSGQNSAAAILNIGWDQSDRGMEGESGELFATAKNAIMGFTRSLAVSLAPEVRVNCIAPGWIKTAWGNEAPPQWQERVLRETPLMRWGVPDDIARLARFLMSDAASYLTGQVVNANGGAVR